MGVGKRSLCRLISHRKSLETVTGNIVTILWGIKHFKHVCPGGKCQILEASIAVKIAFS